jgi:uncharacterized protein
MPLRLIIGAIVLYLLYKLIRGWKSIKGSSKPDLKAVGEDLVEDLFCHTYVPVSHAVKAVIEGKTLYFCSQQCLEQYKAQRSSVPPCK